MHGDYTLTSAPQRLRDLTRPPGANDTLRKLLGSDEALLDEAAVERAIDSGRFAIINVWRNVAQEPVATHPLALCDAASVSPEDLVVFEIHYHDRVGENYFAKHAERHRWYFYQALTRDEALLIKQWDSAANWHDPRGPRPMPPAAICPAPSASTAPSRIPKHHRMRPTAGASRCAAWRSTTDRIRRREGRPAIERKQRMLAPDGRVIMVSGANRGIGRAIAEALYGAGYSLSLGARNPDSFAGMVAGWAPERMLTARYDAEDQASHRQWVEATAEHFGRIDGLVNNAGIAVRVTVEEENDEALDRMWAVNVKGPLSMIRTALPHLRRSGAGRVVNIASIAGKALYNNNVGYAMTKFAAVALSHATRRAGWDDGVRCTAVCPGFVATDMTADVETFPHDKMMDPGDIAEVVLTVLALSNKASIAELVVNCRDDVTM